MQHTNYDGLTAGRVNLQHRTDDHQHQVKQMVSMLCVRAALVALCTMSLPEALLLSTKCVCSIQCMIGGSAPMGGGCSADEGASTGRDLLTCLD